MVAEIVGRPTFHRVVYMKLSGERGIFSSCRIRGRGGVADYRQTAPDHLFGSLPSFFKLEKKVAGFQGLRDWAKAIFRERNTQNFDNQTPGAHLFRVFGCPTSFETRTESRRAHLSGDQPGRGREQSAQSALGTPHKELVALIRSWWGGPPTWITGWA